MANKISLFFLILCFNLCAAVEGSIESVEKPVVVFDFGGVMAEFDLSQLLEYSAAAFNMPLANFKQAMKKDIDHLATGSIEEEDFWTLFATQNNVRLPFQWKRQYMAFIKELVQPRQEMYTFLNTLKASGYRVALFSDVTAWQAESFRELGLYHGFSDVILSCEIGARKPHLESYLLLLEEVEVRPEFCIFVDDRVENVEAAKAMGIKGILYTSFKEVQNAVIDELAIAENSHTD